MGRGTNTPRLRVHKRYVLVALGYRLKCNVQCAVFLHCIYGVARENLAFDVRVSKRNSCHSANMCRYIYISRFNEHSSCLTAKR